MKRILTGILAFCLMLSCLCLPAAAAQKNGFSNFQTVNTYSADTFIDVSGWYADYVAKVYSLGLMQGNTNENGTCSFNPNGPITLAETLALASRIHSIYTADGETFVQSTPWYQTYVDYAVKDGILSSAEEYSDYLQPATRAQFVSILAKALPDEAYAEINTVETDAIPDVSLEYNYSFGVYKLYRAGVLTGSDALGTFHPSETISRSEVAAIASRIADPAARVSLALYAPLYVGFTMDDDNKGSAGITGLTITTEGTTYYLTIDFKSQQSRFLSIMNASESLYILKVVVIDPGADHFTFAFPKETLEEIYNSSEDPDSEKLIMEFYASSDPGSITDRFYIPINQFSKYFEVSAALSDSAASESPSGLSGH